MEIESGGSPGRSHWTRWITPSRLWEFGKTVAGLARSVRKVEEENRDLQDRVRKLELQVAEHGAQLRLLSGFVRESLTNRLEARIEKLAAELLANKNKN